MGLGHADEVGADGVLAEGDGEAVARGGPVGRLENGALHGLVELSALPENVFDVGVGLEAGDGERNDALLPG